MEKVLLTGGSGFLGSVIRKYLNSYILTTLGRGQSEAINSDLSKSIPVIQEKFDWVIHAAGKAHAVPKTLEHKRNFFDVNLNGTNNLLKGLDHAPDLPKAFIFISSVAVYGSTYGEMISENSPLLAKDAYGKSKIMAELLVQNWCAVNNVKCAILRLPLLVGEDPPGNLGAMIKGIKKGYYFNIAGGKARKSMVMASDVAKLIPTVADIGGTYNLTDGHHPTFDELSQSIAKQLCKNKPLNIPLGLAKIVASIGDLLGSKAPINTSKLNKITSDLTFTDLKARKKLKWNPSSVIDSFKVT